MQEIDTTAETPEEAVTTARVRLTPDGRMSLGNAATYLGVHEQTLRNWRLRGTGPRSIKVAGRVWFYRHDLDHFIARGAA
jgi:hypothetical protein